MREAAALGRVLQEYESARAKERQREHGNTAPGRKKNTPEKFSEVKESRAYTRDRVGKEYESARAKERQREAGKKHGRGRKAPENFSEAKGARAYTRDRVGMRQPAVNELLSEIANWRIPPIGESRQYPASSPMMPSPSEPL